MGGNHSCSLTILDLTRVREWLLLTLEHRFKIEESRKGNQSPSIQIALLCLFQRYDTTSKGLVPLEAALVVAHDLTLDSKRPHDFVEHFCGLFASDDDDVGAPLFNYKLFVDFVFFPVERRPQSLKLKQSIATIGPLEVFPSELLSEAWTPVQTEPNRKGDRGFHVVAKKLSLVSSSREEERAIAFTEGVTHLREAVNYLRLFTHPNITRFVTTIQNKDALYLIEENHQSCTLKTILESFGAMKEPTIRRYLLQLLQALQYLHAHDIAHGNLSTQTVNIDSYGLLKVSGFGISTHLDTLTSSPPADKNESGVHEWTLQYPPPETAKDAAAVRGKKSDIWRVGILILQMANGFPKENDRSSHASPTPSFSGNYGQQRSPQKRSASSPSVSGPPQKNGSARKSALPPLPQTVSRSLRTLVRACLQTNPRKRVSVDELIEMDFFQVDHAQATNEMLRTVCTDLDASMKRLISSSSSPNAMHKRFGGNTSPARNTDRSASAFVTGYPPSRSTASCHKRPT